MIGVGRLGAAPGVDQSVADAGQQIVTRTFDANLERQPIQARGAHEGQAVLGGLRGREHVRPRVLGIACAQILFDQRFGIGRAAGFECARQCAVNASPLPGAQRADDAVADPRVIRLDELLAVHAKCPHQARRAQAGAQRVVS